MSHYYPDEEFYVEAVDRTPPGGQTTGLTPPTVRVRHIFTSTEATCSAQTSQMKNRKLARDMVEFALMEMGWERGAR